MAQDCLRFKPTIATLCYGMNDHRYKPYDEAVATWYRDNYGAVAKGLKEAGARVVIGSPGPVGKMPSWVKTASRSRHHDYAGATNRNQLDRRMPRVG